MYILFSVFIFIAILFSIFCVRRRCIIKKVCCLSFCQKINMLNDITEPFGFLYYYPEDVFTSTHDAWQRKFGYCTLYDTAAPLFNMALDCEPVYFDYEGKTWLIQLWKGQYGLNTGAEIGVYHADTIIPRSQRNVAVFHAAENREMLRMSYCLSKSGGNLFTLSGYHWWLTGFRLGLFSNPRELDMCICLTFPDKAMLEAFTDSLMELGYSRNHLNLFQLSVSFCFSTPKSTRSVKIPCYRAWYSQWKNKLSCYWYRRLTRCFDNTLDRLTYLQLCLPPLFRRIIRMKKVSGRYKNLR